MFLCDLGQLDVCAPEHSSGDPWAMKHGWENPQWNFPPGHDDTEVYLEDRPTCQITGNAGDFLSRRFVVWFVVAVGFLSG